MSVTEFEANAASWHRLLGMDRAGAIVSACRGSGNPATLAWLAEALELEASHRVVDIGGGLGGPSAWLEARYGCRLVSLDPVADAVRAARTVFGIGAAVAEGARLPLRDRAFDAALLMGVLSVVPDPVAVLVEARRVAPRLGLIVYCSTGTTPVACGGSVFRPLAQVEGMLHTAGWHLRAGPTDPALSPPPSWADTSLGPPQPDEEPVTDALADGRIAPVVAAAQAAH